MAHRYPEVDLLPCPWIRRFWNLAALTDVASLDRIISMDTYTDNSTEHVVAATTLLACGRVVRARSHVRVAIHECRRRAHTPVPHSERARTCMRSWRRGSEACLIVLRPRRRRSADDAAMGVVRVLSLVAPQTADHRSTTTTRRYVQDILQYHLFFPIERIGVGLCPLGCGHAPPTSACLRGRIAHAAMCVRFRNVVRDLFSWVW
jgi:hypothetical protein